MLELEKDGERQTFSFDLSPLKAAAALKRIKELMKEKWNLIDCTGDNPTIVAFIKNSIKSYAEDAKNFKVPIREIASVAVNAARSKEWREAAKKDNESAKQ